MGHNKRRIYFKNIFKTLMRLEQLDCNIVKVADSRMDLQTTLTMTVTMKFIVDNRTDALKTDINLFFT